MSLLEIDKNVAQPIFCQNLIRKCSQKIGLHLSCFEKLPKENNHPLGKNSGHPGDYWPIVFLRKFF
jgi:hypothetical protein